ncbi:MAG TPA: hypothetical protein VIL48_00250 [Acidimicrobiales bacterium]
MAAETISPSGPEPEPGSAADPDPAPEPPAAPGAAAGRAAPERGRDRLRTRGRAAAAPAALVLALAVPLAVALGVLAEPRWYPQLDVAMTELRIRDVTTTHPPLVGLPGRIEGLGTAGSHPGPISFWALAPFYRVYGASAWAMQAATATLNLGAMAATLWVAHRRAGRLGLLGAAVALAVLVRYYEAERLTEAWNPYLPMTWWALFLLAVWSVLCDDLALLPVAGLAGTFCAQTHVPYAGLVAGLGALTVAAVGARLWRRRADPVARRRLLRWSGATVALVGVLWLPPVVEQVRGDPGNLAVLVDSLRHPDEPPAGLADGLEAWLAKLDLRTLVTKSQRVEGSPVPGLLLLAAWAAAAAVAVRRRRRPGGWPLVRLHAVVAAALALGAVSIVRIPGHLWDYLVLWATSTTVLALAATLATVAVATAGGATEAGAPRRAPSRSLAPAVPAAVPALVAALVVVAASATYDAAHAQVPQPGVSRIDRHVIPPTIAALRRGDAPGGGRDGRYLITWDDALTPGLNGYAFLLELERQGFDAGMEEAWELGARPHRVMAREEATAVVTYVAGPRVAEWRRRPDAVEVAAYDPPAEDRAAFARLRAEATERLREHGVGELAAGLDTNLLGTQVDPRMPADVVPLLRRMLDLGAPAAVFVTPADTSPDTSADTPAVAPAGGP